MHGVGWARAGIGKRVCATEQGKGSIRDIRAGRTPGGEHPPFPPKIPSKGADSVGVRRALLAISRGVLHP